MIPVQIAIQGGGAKFVNLLAAIQPFQDMQTTGRIEVTNVAGTSAGSIVASLVAMQAPISKINEYLKKNAEAVVFQATSKLRSRLSSRIGYAYLMWEVYRGIPIVDPRLFSDFLKDMFKYAMAPIPVPESFNAIKELTGTVLKVVASDIRGRSGAYLFRK
jgi:predicted acylesterase/phospholipase RssA